MDDPSDDDVVRGVMRLRFGGVETRVKTLPIGPAHDWLQKLEARFDQIAAAATDDKRQAALIQLAVETTDSAVELVAAYDRDGAIEGGAAWLRANAFPREIHDALEQMRVAAIPFGEEATMMGLMVAAALRRAALLDQPSSTSSPSPTGTSTPPRSNRASRRRS